MTDTAPPQLPREVLELKANALVATLEMVQQHLSSLALEVNKVLDQMHNLDASYGISPSDTPEALAAVLENARKVMPNLEHLSDEALLKMFGRGKK